MNQKRKRTRENTISQKRECVRITHADNEQDDDDDDEEEEGARANTERKRDRGSQSTREREKKKKKRKRALKRTGREKIEKIQRTEQKEDKTNEEEKWVGTRTMTFPQKIWAIERGRLRTGKLRRIG